MLKFSKKPTYFFLTNSLPQFSKPSLSFLEQDWSKVNTLCLDIIDGNSLKSTFFNFPLLKRLTLQLNHKIIDKESIMVGIQALGNLIPKLEYFKLENGIKCFCSFTFTGLFPKGVKTLDLPCKDMWHSLKTLVLKDIEFPFNELIGLSKVEQLQRVEIDRLYFDNADNISMLEDIQFQNLSYFQMFACVKETKKSLFNSLVSKIQKLEDCNILAEEYKSQDDIDIV